MLLRYRYAIKEIQILCIKVYEKVCKCLGQDLHCVGFLAVLIKIAQRPIQKTSTDFVLDLYFVLVLRTTEFTRSQS